ncbi:MAG: hypothetical protein LBQ50_10200 [Planctomycetaceae bacterium]|nr:hypothetical protein [Planctomycetaceae bacterium]
MDTVLAFAVSRLWKTLPIIHAVIIPLKEVTVYFNKLSYLFYYVTVYFVFYSKKEEKKVDIEYTIKIC